MTGISKNLLRFSSLLVAVAMFLGLAVAGCSDDPERDKGNFAPVESDAVVFNMLIDAVAKSSAAVDMYSISAFDASGDYVLGHSFVSPESGMAGSAFYTESGDRRTCTWKIDGIEELAISQFRIDYYAGQAFLGSAFIVEDSPLVVADKIYTEDAETDGFSMVKAEELQDNLQIFVGSEDEPVFELEPGQSAPVSALFTQSVGEKVFVQNAEVELEETEVATLEEDSVGQVLVAAEEVAEPTDVTLTSEVEGAEAVYVVTIVPVAPAPEVKIVFSTADIETMTVAAELSSIEVATTAEAAAPVLSKFKVWEKVLAQTEGDVPTYTEVSCDTTDYTVTVASDDTTGSSVVTEGGFAVQGGANAGVTSVVVTRVGEEDPIATLRVNVFASQFELVFSDVSVTTMTEEDEVTSNSNIYSNVWEFAVWKKQYYIAGEGDGEARVIVGYTRVDRPSCSISYSGEGVVHLDSSDWLIGLDAQCFYCNGTITVSVNDTELTNSVQVTLDLREDS